MINYEHLDNLEKAIGKNTLRTIYLEYRKESTQKIHELFAAWTDKDYQQLEDIGHSLKSSSLNMATQELATLCQSIENAAKQHHNLAIKSAFDTLIQTHEASLKALEAYCYE